MNTRLLYLGLTILFFSVSLLPGQNRDKASAFLKELKEESRKERQEKDNEFRDPHQTPLPLEEVDKFKGLKYFDYNPVYRLTAFLKKYPFPLMFRMKTTTDRAPLYSHYADITFILEGKTITLEVYQNQDLLRQKAYEDNLFLPFTDETSAEETYGGGRFLELRIPVGDSVVVDFNKAYNPYCAYNHTFSCPIPPAVNHIPVKILAGEKTYRDPSVKKGH